MKPFIKTILPSSYNYSDALVSLVDVHSNGVDSAWMTKRAGAGVFKDVNIRPEKGQAYLHLIAMGDSDFYGCFFAGAPVSTASGITPIEQVRVGDMVLTHKNRYRKVLHTFENLYSGVRTELDVGSIPDPVVSTANHPFLVVRASAFTPKPRFERRRGGTFSQWLNELVAAAEWMPADQIKPGDYMVSPCRPEDPEKLVLPDYADPYALGLYVAEGCLAKEYRDIATRGEYCDILYTVSDKDAESIAYVQSWLVKSGRREVAELESYTSEHGVRLQLGWKELATLLDRLFGHTARTKHIHPVVFQQTEEWRLKFLAGYLDGDGCIDVSDSKYTGTVKASTVSRALAFDLQRLAASVDMPLSVSRCYNRESSGCFGRGDLPIYMLSVGSRVSNKVLKHCLRLKPHGRVSTYSGGASLQTSGDYMLLPVFRASSTLVADVYKHNLEVEEDNSYVVDVQGHNSNRNFDAFLKQSRWIDIPEPRDGKTYRIKIAKGNVETHDTFQTTAKVFRDHKNRGKPEGDVIKSAHNDAMNRVELIIKVPDDTWRDDIQKVASGGDLPFSMSCIVPFDICSVCGNKAKNRKDYCDHLKNNGGSITKSGQSIAAINDHMKYFDISRVVVPADRIAFGLLKVASASRVMSGAELAETMDLFPPADVDPLFNNLELSKLGMLSKLSDIEKEIEAVAKNPDKRTETLSKAFDPEVYKKNLGDDELEALKVGKGETSDLLGSLADAKISLSLRDFLRIMMGRRFEDVKDHVGEAENMLPGMFGRLLSKPNMLSDVDDFTLGDGIIPQHARAMINKLGPACSLEDEPVNRRVTITVLRGKSPLKLVRPEELEKTSGVASPLAGRMVAAYAAYKMAFAQRVGLDDKVLLERLILQHYI